MNRRNFVRAVRVEIIKRATRPDGQPACERCGSIGRKLEIHHRVMDAMETDKSRKLTADDGEAICSKCHDPITSEQRKVLAKALAQEALALRVRAAPARPLRSAPMPTTERAAARRSREPRAALPPRQIYEED